MNQVTRIRWRRHRLANTDKAALRRVAENLFPISTVARSAAPAAVEVDETIELPELPESSLGKAATLLRLAAQVEHALMVQYLYAGFSFAPAQRVIVNVAIEEMSHLMTVQNLLRCIGEKPHLHRLDDDADVSEDERLFPFDFRLEPLSHLSLAKYVVAESPTAVPEGVDAAVLAHIADIATRAAHEPVERVGTVYALLGVVFGTPQLLLELAAAGDPWYTVVNDLAAEAETFYSGGPEALHLPDSAFDPASVPGQGSDQDWDRSQVGAFDEFRVHVVASRRDALEALRDIGLQGEGPSPVAGETAHFRRFYDLFTGFFGADGLGTDRPPGVRDVPAGSRIILDPNGSGEGVISHPTTVRWARLADLRYAVLLGALGRYLLAPVDDRAFLRGWCFAEMFALRKLAEFLARLPRSVSAPQQFAALPFTVPTWLATGGQWPDLAAAFDESMTIARALQTEADTSLDQHRLLVLLLASDERKLREATARAAGTSVRTRTDAVRDVLDWAAGAGDPPHPGDSPALPMADQGPMANQGRFWNQQHDGFVHVKIFGEEITTPPPGRKKAPLIDVLQSGFMPSGRPPLAEESDEFLLVERWVADGCPDDTI
jgi:Ferritin-like